MKQLLPPVLLFGLVFILVACAAPPAPIATVIPPTAAATRTPPPTATPIATPEDSAADGAVQPGRPLPVDRNAWFVGSGVCTPCHANLTDESGADVSIDIQWSASLEANAARDPFWQASVRAQVLQNAERAAEIEALCAGCHAPMAVFSALAGDEPVSLFGGGFLDPANRLHSLALDGVSCTLCHQIREDRLGLPSSYNGGYEIDRELPPGERLSFGPYSVDEDSVDQMRRASGFIPVQGLHITQSELCATCHTFYLPSSTGADPFPLQVTYLEWFESDFRRTSSCQDCHMPEAVGGVKIASSSANPRSPYRQHTFVGANAYMLDLLAAFVEETGATASEAQLAQAAERTRDFLQTEGGQIRIDEARVSGRRLRVDLTIEVGAGHKFPTGYPSRRVWIHFQVTDAAGQIVFESGAPQPNGSIAGNDNDIDPARFEPHYLAIVEPDQVQIYETILQGVAGGTTTDVLQAAAYLKDNRLLPVGFDREAFIADLAVQGRAEDDEDFIGGGDSIEYAVDLGDTGGPFIVTAELMYQSIAYPWVEALRPYSAGEIEAFLMYYSSVPNLPVVVASATQQVGN